MANETLVAQSDNLKKNLAKYKPMFEALLPKVVNPKKFVQSAYLLGMKNPKLLDNPPSFIAALLMSAQLGLEVDDARGQAYLVPFWNSAKKRNDVVFIPGYRGLMDLAYRSNRVASITYGVVYDQEPYTYEEGLTPKIDHKPQPPSKRGKEKIAVYAVATMKGGATAHVWLWKEDVEEHRDKSPSWKSYKSGHVKAENCIWLVWEKEMWIKTAIRVLAKFMPQSPELQKAIGVEDMYDGGKDPLMDIKYQMAELLKEQGDMAGAEDLGREIEVESQQEDAGAKAATEQKQSELGDKIKGKEPQPEKKEEAKKDGGAEKKEGGNGKQ